MIDLIDEVKEEMRRDARFAMIRKYGPTAALMVVTFVVVSAATSWYLGYERKNIEGVSIRFFDAMAAEELPNNQITAGAGAEANEGAMGIADEFEQVLSDRVKGFSSLAGMRQAAILATIGEYDKALSAYDAIAEDSSHDKAIRELANLQAVSLMIDHFPDTDETRASIDARLEGLSAQNKPWRYSALELMAFRAWDGGDAERAVELFERLKNDIDVPEGIFQRALKMINLLEATQAADIESAEVGE